MSTPTPCRLFDLPLGSRFRYTEHPEKTYVFLGHGDSGLVGDAPDDRKFPSGRPMQGLYSAAESREEFEAMQVHLVPVVDLSAVDQMVDKFGEQIERLQLAEKGASEAFGHIVEMKKAAERQVEKMQSTIYAQQAIIVKFREALQRAGVPLPI